MLRDSLSASIRPPRLRAARAYLSLCNYRLGEQDDSYGKLPKSQTVELLSSYIETTPGAQLAPADLLSCFPYTAYDAMQDLRFCESKSQSYDRWHRLKLSETLIQLIDENILSGNCGTGTQSDTKGSVPLAFSPGSLGNLKNKSNNNKFQQRLRQEAQEKKSRSFNQIHVAVKQSKAK